MHYMYEYSVNEHVWRPNFCLFSLFFRLAERRRRDVSRKAKPVTSKAKQRGMQIGSPRSNAAVHRSKTSAATLSTPRSPHSMKEIKNISPCSVVVETCDNVSCAPNCPHMAVYVFKIISTSFKLWLFEMVYQCKPNDSLTVEVRELFYFWKIGMYEDFLFGVTAKR